MKCMDTEVYSWRVSRELKSDLERQARIRKTSLSAVLNLAARDWLKQSAMTIGEDEEQRRLHSSASQRRPQAISANRRVARQRSRGRLRTPI